MDGMDVFVLVWVQMMSPWSGIQPWAISRSELFTDKTVCVQEAKTIEVATGITISVRCKKVHLPGMFNIPRHSL